MVANLVTSFGFPRGKRFAVNLDEFHYVMVLRCLTQGRR